ncbi:uncharacterized protein C8A04DRAFT_11932 [Dichotomopilus funicola]|uniref:Uncharacterized protein n=1 Tax=Dichotomopilus funicola TaxID=1934379 RepID=A0AAN6V3V2_9PEZI|nr:hypothetical protein C8A04DRAFT_11932 [Dichotomopilus funicola]
MARPANAAVRESRRGSTSHDIERINVLKALTAAEHSRRQFILNFAASRDTQLSIPGKKSDIIKAAEEWVALWLSQNGFHVVNNEFFKYTVDARLWSAHVGDDLDFPFAFMRERFEPSLSDVSEGELKRPLSDASVEAQEIEVAVATPTKAHTPKKQQARQQAPGPSTPPKRRQTATVSMTQAKPNVPDRKRSMSLMSFDDLKASPKATQQKFPLLVRLGRSWSRRMSSTS